MEHLKEFIRDVPDFPAPGVPFRDITPLLRSPAAFAEVVDHLAARYRDQRVEVVAGVESRGFVFAAPLAIALGAAFVPIRKLGKLPGRTLQREYALEYGTSHLEIHLDAVAPEQRVLLVDDVLATGGTAAASAALVEGLGGEVVEVAFLVELSALGGRAALAGRPTYSVMTF